MTEVFDAAGEVVDPALVSSTQTSLVWTLGLLLAFDLLVLLGVLVVILAGFVIAGEFWTLLGVAVTGTIGPVASITKTIGDLPRPAGGD